MNWDKIEKLVKKHGSDYELGKQIRRLYYGYKEPSGTTERKDSLS
jgi:hypothetical protein